MEYAQIEVRLAGSLENTVIKEVPAAEIPVLKAVHGHDAIVNVKYTRTEAIDVKAERDRLERHFTPAVVEKLFPGINAKLPTTLADIGFESPEETVAKKK